MANQMTFQTENGYLVCYINGKEVNRAKLATIGLTEADVLEIIKANPTDAATQILSKIKIGDTVFSIPEGTNVVANPELAGDENELDGIQIGTTKYKVLSNPVITTETLTFTYEDDTTGTLTVVTGITFGRIPEPSLLIK